MDSGAAPSGVSTMCNCTSWNDDVGCSPPSRRTHPVTVKAIGYPMAELHQRNRTSVDVDGVEHRQIAAVFAGTPDRGQKPAVAFGGIVAARDEHRLGDGVAGWQ